MAVRPRPLPLLVLLALTSTARAQTAQLEEVLVTAQKRLEVLADVPASVAAVSGAELDAVGVTQLEQLTHLVPNLHLTETGLSTQLRVRGIGSDNSQGFEQSVGVYVDGVSRSRAQLLRAPLFDLERAEVLRGPQGTLLGKNSIAGALSLVTAKPTDNYQGRLLLRSTNADGAEQADGFIAGPIAGELKGRLAVRYLEADGYMTNTSRDDAKEPGRSERAARLSLAYTPLTTLAVDYVAEYSEFDSRGRPVEITRDQSLGGTGYAPLLARVNGGETYESSLDYRRQADGPESSDNKVLSHTLTASGNIGDYQWTATTGALDFDYLDHCDCDFTPANLMVLEFGENYRQYSQELRLLSPRGGRVEWLAGAFYQHYEQDYRDLLSLEGDSRLPDLLEQIPLPVPDVLAGNAVAREFDQESEAIAVFGELIWHPTETLHINLGGRYTEERKDASKIVTLTRAHDPSSVLEDPVAAGVFQQLFQVDSVQLGGHDLMGERTERKFTPSLTVSVDYSADTLAYGKISRGFKAGGFDPRSNNVANFEFEDESVTAYEVGYKIGLAEGAGELNFALYHMDYRDLQISQFDGAVGFNVGNAEKTRVRGVEVDGRWQFTSNLSGRYGVSWLSFEYKSFTEGDCYAGQEAGPSGYCDYSGRRGPYAPTTTVNAGLDYQRELSAGLQFQAMFDLQWLSRHNVHANLDPSGRQGAYGDASLRLALGAEHWQVALLGTNLFDREVATYSANVPLAERLGGSNTHYTFVRPPRAVSVETILRF